MPPAVYRMMTLLCSLVVTLPIGTNVGLLHLLWMLVSGQLLGARGAVIPGLSACGLPDRAVRRAWAALGQGEWACDRLLARWRTLVVAEGRWQPHTHGGYRPVAVDVTAFWRPRLQGCPTVHYHAEAGRALPAIPLGLIARVGSVGSQRLALPLTIVRADVADPRPGTQERLVVRAAVHQCGEDDAVVLDAGFGLALLQEEGATRYVVRCAKNSVFRRATPPPYGGRGRPATRGDIVRPLPRTYKGRPIPATPPDRTETWEEDGVTLRAEIWANLVLPTAATKAKTEPEVKTEPEPEPEPHPPRSPWSPCMTRATGSHCSSPRRSPSRPVCCGSSTTTAGRSSNCPWPPNRCSAPRARSSTPPRPASGCPNAPSSPGPSCLMGRPPLRPSRPVSGTAAPNPRPAASGAPSRARHFRMTSRSPPLCAQKRPVLTISPPASGANGGGARPPKPLLRLT